MHQGVRFYCTTSANGVQIISINEANCRDADRAEEEKLYALLDAQVERNKIRKRTGRGLKRNAEEGLTTGGTPPLGYNVNGKKRFVVNAYEAEAVALAFGMFAAGFSKKKIADELNKKGFRTKRGNQFKVTSFDAIFSNCRYIGQNKYGDMKNLPPIPAIVERDVFDKVQERLANRRRRTGGTSIGAKSKYPLSGRVICQHCGAVLQVDKSRNGRNKALRFSMFCPNRKRKACDLKPISMTRLSEYIIQQICVQITDSADALKSNIAGVHKKLSAKDKKAREAINREIGLVERDLQNLSRRLCEPDDDMVSTYVAQIRDKRKRKQELADELEVICNKERPNINDARLNTLLSAVGNELFSDEVSLVNKKALDTILERVTVSNDEIVLTLNLP